MSQHTQWGSRHRHKRHGWFRKNIKTIRLLFYVLLAAIALAIVVVVVTMPLGGGGENTVAVDN